ncbi:MAG TPA: DNA topoisomerase IV subunit A, partial [Verrucomicrobia bacterium]|nr:DNA topoisomerase IV subunit A [Verrucomicrobiota bacterium]
MAGKEDSSEKQAHDRLGVNETETEETKIEEPQKTGSSGNGDLVPPTNSYVQNGSSDDPLDGIDGVLRLQIDDNFLQYASYVIRDRAIPKLDDGLKPVQRRILWSLHRNDDGKFIKVANITGYTMQFHPHGDASINDALVVLANKRYLIEGQGNYGNIYTGDRAAASRYIECRLTELARKEIFNDELTEFVSSYDGRNKEPVVLPCKLPMLLMLGADGIAVGLSARILPHNFIELLEAEIAVLRKKPFTILPDFVLGGLMDASDYNDGNGKIRIRARIEVKDKSRLIIRQLPFSTTTESLVNSIEDAARKGKIKIRSIQDFTSENVEIEILLGIGVEPDKAKQALYAFTDCEVPIS